MSIGLRSDGLERFENTAPTSHIKVHLRRDSQTEALSRTYTPRRFDATTGTLEVQFLLHGEGAASEWAAQAKPGDHLAISGPGGRFRFDSNVIRWCIAGDESAIPAVGTPLDALPTTARAEVHLEVGSADDEIEFASAASLDIFWHHRTHRANPVLS